MFDVAKLCGAAMVSTPESWSYQGTRVNAYRHQWNLARIWLDSYVQLAEEDASRISRENSHPPPTHPSFPDIEGTGDSSSSAHSEWKRAVVGQRLSISNKRDDNPLLSSPFLKVFCFTSVSSQNTSPECVRYRKTNDGAKDRPCPRL